MLLCGQMIPVLLIYIQKWNCVIFSFIIFSLILLFIIEGGYLCLQLLFVEQFIFPCKFRFLYLDGLSLVTNIYSCIVLAILKLLLICNVLVFSKLFWFKVCVVWYEAGHLAFVHWNLHVMCFSVISLTIYLCLWLN